jgi:hypothetical protein
VRIEQALLLLAASTACDFIPPLTIAMPFGPRRKGVLTETVMHTCIKQLLEEVNPSALGTHPPAHPAPQAQLCAFVPLRFTCFSLPRPGRPPFLQVGNPKPEDVECMCKLLSTVGGMLDASTKSVKNFNNSGKQFSTKVGGWVQAGGRAGGRAWKLVGDRRPFSF